MDINNDEYIDMHIENLDNNETIDFDDADDTAMAFASSGIKSHLEEGDQIVWYKDPSIIATWHTDGTVDLAGKEHLAICSATFYASKGHWRDKATEHGVGKEPQHWIFNGNTIKDIQEVFGDFWEATDKPDKSAKTGTTVRKKKRIAENNTDYEPIKVEVADWELEDYKIFRKTLSPLKSVICYEVNYNIFEEYSVNALDKYVNNNGVYIMLNGSEPYYVGQADNVFNRVQMHITDKHSGRWEKALLFVSKNNELTKDYQDVLEMRLIDETAGRGAKIVNGTIGNKVNATTVYSNNTMKYDNIIRFIAEASYKLGYDFLVRSTYSNKTVNAIGNAQTELAKDESKTNVIVTPRWIVEDMLNLLPEQAFGYGTTILDFAIKDGAFLQSAFERSFNNKDLIARFPDENRRKFYISQFKLFGVIQAATQADYGIDLYAHLNGIVAKEHLIVVDYEKELFDKDGKIFKGKSLEILAKDIIQRFGDNDMKIDYVVGNPPYQKDTGGGKAGGTAIWPAFIDMGKSLKPEAMTMITPSRWFTGGQGLNQFRIAWMNDKHIDTIVHYNNAKNVFENTSIAGGVSYFLWKDNHNTNDINFENKETSEKVIRKLNRFDIFIPNTLDEHIVEKVMNYIAIQKLSTFDSIVGSGGQYGLSTDWRGTTGCINVITSSGIFKCDTSDIKEIPNDYRVVISNVMCEHAGESSKDGTYKVITTVQIADPNTVTAGHYVPVGGYSNIDEATNCAKYIKTKILRFLLRLRAVGIGISSDCWKFIPVLDFTANSDIDWSQPISNIDQQLYKKYGLTQEEIDYIEKTIKPME